MSKNVITAGPSAGKTSTLRELSGRGYYIVPEAARMHIDQEISEGRDEKDIHSDPEFQQNIIDLDRELEESMPKYVSALTDDINEVDIFMDRSLADNVAYLRYFGEMFEPDQTGIAKETEDLRKVNQIFDEVENRYDNVFLLEQLPFEDDYARREDAEQARELHEEIRTAYEDAGYDVIEIPLMPIDKRADKIEEYL